MWYLFYEEEECMTRQRDRDNVGDDTEKKCVTLEKERVYDNRERERERKSLQQMMSVRREREWE